METPLNKIYYMVAYQKDNIRDFDMDEQFNVRLRIMCHWRANYVEFNWIS